MPSFSHFLWKSPYLVFKQIFYFYQVIFDFRNSNDQFQSNFNYLLAIALYLKLKFQEYFIYFFKIKIKELSAIEGFFLSFT